MALLAVRWWLPTEGGAEGTTLEVAWWGMFAALAVAVSAAWGRAQRLSWQIADTAVLLLVGGHLLGGLVVFLSEGDRRAAASLMVEWFSLGTLWGLIRRMVSTASGRGTLVATIAVLGVGLAGLGLYQQFVEFPEVAREYRALRERGELARELVTTGRTAPVELAEIEREMAQLGVPSDPGGRMLWELRLLDSQEPIGFFALTNTLAGVLLVALLVGVGRGLVDWNERPRDWLRLILGLLGVLLVGCCLLLTKSRTAYVGALFGVALFLAGLRYQNRTTPNQTVRDPRRMWIAVGLVAAVVSLLVAGLAATGGLDWLILSEAMKSIRYRGEYWWGTTQMLLSSPSRLCLGVGLGQFRNNYLPFKLASSSEEIADPHNLLLDVWSNGGLVALAGLVLLVGSLVRRVIRGEWATDGGPGPVPRIPWAGLAGLLIALVGALVNDGGTDDRLLFVGGAVLILLGIVSVPRCEAVLVLACASAALALCLHLLAAGGIGMPAVTATLMALIAVTLAPASTATDVSESHTTPSRRLIGWLVVAGLFAVFLASQTWAVMPSRTATRMLAEADAAFYVRRDLDSAIRSCEVASRTDHWSPEASDKLGQLLLLRWRELPLDATADMRDAAFRDAVGALEAAVSKDPHSSVRLRAVGMAWRERWRQSVAPVDAEQAAAWLRRALERYPNDANLAVDYAEVAVPTESRSAALRALELDQLAERYGHVDKRLSPERRSLAETLSK